MNNYTMVLMGATGNLAKLKIYLALMELYEHGIIDDSFNLIGVSNDNFTQHEFKSFIKDAVGSNFNFSTHYVQLDIMRDNFDVLSKIIRTESNTIFYLSISPSLFQYSIRKILRIEGIFKTPVKVLLEKPYGVNYEDTVELNELIFENDFEDKVYRIDHYLAKAGTERLLKFKNSHVDKWNNKYINEVTITLAETIGIDERMDFYRETGAIADVVQNHIFQLLLRIVSDDQNREKYIHHILDSLDDEKNYFKSKQYLDFEKETMFYGRMYINSNIWENVAFNIITGKRMAEKSTKIEIEWNDHSRYTIDFSDNSDSLLSEYSLLILDCMHGNHTKFVSKKGSEATWLFGNGLCKLLSSDIEKYEEGNVSADDVFSWIYLKE